METVSQSARNGIEQCVSEIGRLLLGKGEFFARYQNIAKRTQKDFLKVSIPLKERTLDFHTHHPDASNPSPTGNIVDLPSIVPKNRAILGSIDTSHNNTLKLQSKQLPHSKLGHQTSIAASGVLSTSDHGDSNSMGAGDNTKLPPIPQRFQQPNSVCGKGGNSFVGRSKRESQYQAYFKRHGPKNYSPQPGGGKQYSNRGEIQVYDREGLTTKNKGEYGKDLAQMQKLAKERAQRHFGTLLESIRPLEPSQEKELGWGVETAIMSGSNKEVLIRNMRLWRYRRSQSKAAAPA